MTRRLLFTFAYAVIFFAMVLTLANLRLEAKSTASAERETGAPTAKAETLPPPFGAQVYEDTVDDSFFTQPLLESGVKWVRIVLKWEYLEEQNSTPDNYNWPYADRLLALAQNDSIELIVTISNNPGWASPYLNGPLYPGMEAEMAQFVRALVERYDGDGVDDAPGSPTIRYWEMYNEPDRWTKGVWPRFGDEPLRYLEMLASVYPAVKAANGEAQILFGGMAYDWFTDQGGRYVRDFMDIILENGGGAYFDIMNFHAYPNFSHNWTGRTDRGPGLLEKAQAIRDVMAAYGVDKPIMVTESGFHSNGDVHPPGSQEIQARYVVEIFTQGLAARSMSVIWWMFYDEPGSWDNGLITYGPSPYKKKAYYAFQTMVSLLSDARFERALQDSETGAEEMEAYEFHNPATGRPLYVAWLDPVDTTLEKPLAIPARVANTINIYGAAEREMDADDGSEDGAIALTVGGQPLYVEVLALPGETPPILDVFPDSVTLFELSSEVPVTTSITLQVSNPGWSPFTFQATAETRGGPASSMEVELVGATGTLSPGQETSITAHFSSPTRPPGVYKASIFVEAPVETIDHLQQIDVTIYVFDEIHTLWVPALHRSDTD